MQLNLENVKFINLPAKDANYKAGNVFFMYSPFEGKMLSEMLLVLKNESRSRVIRIFSYGPCSQQLRQEKWLTCVNNPLNSDYSLHEFVTGI